jgi:menaquinone-dependent protoporphyrinogen oxidase
MKLTSSGSTNDSNHPQTNESASLKFPDSSCGDKSDHKILVAYASEFGTTRDVAEVIGEVLCEGGASVDIKWVNNVKDLNHYDAVIIGSAIQYDKWMPEAIQFVTTHQNSLSQLPVAYFFTCLTLSRLTEKTERQAMAYSDKIYSLLPQVKPVSVGRFAGVLDYSKMSFFYRQISRVLYFILGVKEGDYRDRDAIRAWAKAMQYDLSIK